jgi:spore maturation protein CgeB
VLFEDGVAESLRRHGLETILARHTCAHRVDELLAICRTLDAKESAVTAS